MLALLLLAHVFSAATQAVGAAVSVVAAVLAAAATGMPHFAQIAVVVGALLPAIIGAIKQTGWSTRQQSVVAFAICAAAAFITAWVEGKVNVHDVGAAFSYIYGATIVTYHGVWKPTGAGDAITKATDLDKGPPSK